jgi:LPS-assembly protein
LRGNVVVSQGDREIRADEVDYDASDTALDVRGKVEYRDPVVRVRGESGAYSETRGANIEGAEFELPARPARGRADKVSVGVDGRIGLDGVEFTTCPATNPDWRLRARRLDLNTGDREGSGRNTRIEFKGVPILYLPYISFPLGSQRKSGFLFPDGGFSSRSGAQLTAPWYWNVRPQLDATISPTIYTRRGIDLGGELRFLSRRQRGELQFSVLPSDNIYGESRGRAALHYGADWASGWRARIAAENVSDSEYYEDFAQGPEGTSAAFAARNLELSYRGEHWRLLGQAQHFQTIDRSLAPLDRPYARLPRLLASGAYRFGPVQLRFDGESVNFVRGVGVNGWRSDLLPRATLDLSSPGWYLRPTAGYRYTSYRLDDVVAGQPRSPDRSLPFAQLDAGLILERSRSAKRRITLEPRLQYLYIPYRDQSQLPIFDTALPDLSLAQMFSGNRYVGADRVNDANQLTTAVTMRLFDNADGGEKLAATLGETWYRETPRAGLPGEPLRRGKRGDVIGELALTAWRDFNVSAGLQWNPEASRSERAQLRLQYQPARDRVVNIAYRMQNNIDLRLANVSTRSGIGRLEQAEISAAWPVRDRWHLFARNVYDLGARTSLDQFVGLEYRACCYRIRAVSGSFPIAPASAIAASICNWN